MAEIDAVFENITYNYLAVTVSPEYAFWEMLERHGRLPYIHEKMLRELPWLPMEIAQWMNKMLPCCAWLQPADIAGVVNDFSRTLRKHGYLVSARSQQRYLDEYRQVCEMLADAATREGVTKVMEYRRWLWQVRQEITHVLRGVSYA